MNAFILYKTSKRAKGLWNQAAQQKHTLAWFKENIILELCGNFTTRKYAPAAKLSTPSIPLQTIQAAMAHQILPASQISGRVSGTARCFGFSIVKRTACAICKVPYCYECGQIHITDMLLHQSTSISPEDVESNPE